MTPQMAICMPKRRYQLEKKEIISRVEKEFGSRFGFLGHQILTLSMTGQKCDITFFKRKPALDVKVDKQINLAVMYGAGANKLQSMLENIKLSNGDSVNINEIWTINPMPHDGFSKKVLDAIDMSEAEQEAGPNGETLREMIKNTYHCESRDEENYYLRRFIAS
jgi:hypothetical protein